MGAGFLGMSYSPFVVQNPNAPIANLQPPGDVDRIAVRAPAADARPGRERVHRPAQEPGGRRSQGGLRQDDPDDELAATRTPSTSGPSRPTIREAYGKGSFGSGCLMARRLVEQGVTLRRGRPRRLGHAREQLRHPLPAPAPRARQGDGGAGRRPGPARAARQHADRLDGRVRPDAADQPERRPRPLAAELVGGRWAAAA